MTEHSAPSKSRSQFLCPHGFDLRDNTCGICSEGRPNSPKPNRTFIAVVEPWHDRMRIAGRIILMEKVCEKLGAPYPLPAETIGEHK